MGYWAHPAARGRGVTSSAVRTAADWCLSSPPNGLGLRQLYLLAAAGNSASQRVAEHAGFTYVGTERGSARLGEEEWDDSALYDRLREA